MVRGGPGMIRLIKLEQHSSPDMWALARGQDGAEGGMVLVMFTDETRREEQCGNCSQIEITEIGVGI